MGRGREGERKSTDETKTREYISLRSACLIILSFLVLFRYSMNNYSRFQVEGRFSLGGRKEK